MCESFAKRTIAVRTVDMLIQQKLLKEKFKNDNGKTGSYPVKLATKIFLE